MNNHDLHSVKAFMLSCSIMSVYQALCPVTSPLFQWLLFSLLSASAPIYKCRHSLLGQALKCIGLTDVRQYLNWHVKCEVCFLIAIYFSLEMLNSLEPLLTMIRVYEDSELSHKYSKIAWKSHSKCVMGTCSVIKRIGLGTVRPFMLT